MIVNVLNSVEEWKLIGILIFSYLAVHLSIIDIKTLLLPHSLTLPLLGLGLLFNFFNWYAFFDEAILGALCGYSLLWGVNALYKFYTGNHGIGGGDFTLLGAIGAWTGWLLLPIVLLIASVSASLYGLGLLAFKKHLRTTPYAFGPFLALAGWIALIWGDNIAAILFKI